jgi:hypothetical protein
MPKLANPVFVIEPVVRRYRYLFRGGRTMEVSSPYKMDSTDREMVLKEAQRRWGGKKDDWQIVGSTEIKEEEIKDDGQVEADDGGTTTAGQGKRAGASGTG